MPAFADEVHVHLAEGRQVTVRVVSGELAAFVVGRDQLVRIRSAGRAALPDSRAQVGQFDAVAAARDSGDGTRERSACADEPPAVAVFVEAEHIVRGVVGTGGYRVEDLVSGCDHFDPFTCRMCTGSWKASSRTKL